MPVRKAFGAAKKLAKKAGVTRKGAAKAAKGAGIATAGAVVGGRVGYKKGKRKGYRTGSLVGYGVGKGYLSNKGGKLTLTAKGQKRMTKRKAMKRK